MWSCLETESCECCSSLYNRKLFVPPIVTTHIHALTVVEMEIEKSLSENEEIFIRSLRLKNGDLLI